MRSIPLFLCCLRTLASIGATLSTGASRAVTFQSASVRTSLIEFDASPGALIVR
jgi:hypothetical protein